MFILLSDKVSFPISIFIFVQSSIYALTVGIALSYFSLSDLTISSIDMYNYIYETDMDLNRINVFVYINSLFALGILVYIFFVTYPWEEWYIIYTLCYLFFIFIKVFVLISEEDKRARNTLKSNTNV